MNLRIFDSLDDLSRAAARTIVQQAADGTTIALSGGSTPQRLYEILGGETALDARAIGWVTVDERHVPRTDPQSNAGMIDRTLFARGMAPGHWFLRFETELGEPAAVAQAFEEQWAARAIGKLWIVVLGFGEDGHTASLCPGTEALAVEDRVATEVFVPKLGMWRETLTFPAIREARLRIVLASGASKREIVRQVREGSDLPIAHATGGGIETWWFADRAAVPE
jgi:6-phosphogluconolactonase